MRFRAALALPLLAATLLSGCGGGSDSQIEPGDRVGEMLVTTGTSPSPSIFDFCQPIALQPGVYSRDCTVPAVPQLFIGYGPLADSPKDLDRAWKAQAWQAYLDGRPIKLASFGTLPDRSFFLAAVGSTVWLREWNVLLVEPTPGEHTLQYISEDTPEGGGEPEIYDTTWTFTVTGG